MDSSSVCFLKHASSHWASPTGFHGCPEHAPKKRWVRHILSVPGHKMSDIAEGIPMSGHRSSVNPHVVTLLPGWTVGLPETSRTFSVRGIWWAIPWTQMLYSTNWRQSMPARSHWREVNGLGFSREVRTSGVTMRHSLMQIVEGQWPW